MENEKTVLKDYAELELNLHKEKHQAAMENLSNIINDLQTKITTNNSYKDLLIVYLIKRIKINFNNQNYENVVEDVTLVKALGENLYKNKEIFIIYEHSLMQQNITQTEKRFKQAKIEFEYDEDIVSITNKIANIDVKDIYSKNTVTKSVAKKQKTH